MISVAMCTYNGSRYLAEQLNSIIHQTMPPDEIVICDDCSKDDSVAIAKKILSNWKGKTQIVVNQKNLGFRKNFQKAINLCHGDIIFLSDQDDVWDLEKIQLMMYVFNTDPDVSLVFHDSQLVDSQLNMLYPSFWKNSLLFDYQAFQRGIIVVYMWAM
jgi:glycosyltransferase involved in cell wall biosynthesis